MPLYKHTKKIYFIQNGKKINPSYSIFQDSQKKINYSFLQLNEFILYWLYWEVDQVEDSEFQKLQ